MYRFKAILNDIDVLDFVCCNFQSIILLHCVIEYCPPDWINFNNITCKGENSKQIQHNSLDFKSEDSKEWTSKIINLTTQIGIPIIACAEDIEIYYSAKSNHIKHDKYIECLQGKNSLPRVFASKSQAATAAANY